MAAGFQTTAQLPIYKQYGKQIIAAEQNIVAGKLPAALQAYDSAFTVKAPFATDAYNYAVCALEANRMDLARKGCLLLCKLGVGEKYFEQSAFDKVRQQPEWQTIRKQAESDKKKIEKQSAAYWAELDSLFVIDQATAFARRKKNRLCAKWCG